MDSKKGSDVDSWELCEPPPQLHDQGEETQYNIVQDMKVKGQAMNELREEIALLKKTVGNLEADLKEQISKQTNKQKMYLNPQYPKLNNAKEENGLVKPNTTTGKNGNPCATSVWAITNIGEIFVNEKHIDTLAQLKDEVEIQEINLTGTTTPVTVALGKGCLPGTEIIIAGYIQEDAKRMHINLDSHPMDRHNYDKNLVHGENINFHFNPRFANDPYEQDVVVRNTMTDGGWGYEERKGEMPFDLGSDFILKILCHYDCFKVYVDDKLYCTYKHRQSPYTITRMCICRDVTPYKVTIKNVKPKMNTIDVLWQQLGGHLKSIESCRTGITCGIGCDNTVWVYNGGWGGSFFGNPSNFNVNPMIDHEDYYVYESQLWNPDTGYTSSGLITDNGVWDAETNNEKSAEDFVKLISMDWQWISDWKIDFQEPGIDSEGWQYITKEASNSDDKFNEKYRRRRRWVRKCALKTIGPWMELKDKQFLDMSLVILDDDKFDSGVILWALTLDGQITVGNEISQSNIMGTKWKDVTSEQPLISISCGPYNYVWAIGKDGNAYKRVGINSTNLYGDSWKCVNFPGSSPLKQVSVGKIGVWVLDCCGKLHVRAGITSDIPEGSHWQSIVMDNYIADSTSTICFKQVSVGQTEVWAITETGTAVERLGISYQQPDGIGWSKDLPGTWQYLTVRAL